MKVYDRLMMEVSNQQYLTEEQYKQYLIENDLNPMADYVKADMQKQLYFTVIDILEAMQNDIDVMTSISTDFTDISQAYEYLENRVLNLKDKIASIPDPEEEYSAFSLMYTRGGKKTRATGSGGGTIVTDDIESISKGEIDALIKEVF